MTMGELRTYAAMAPVPFEPAGAPVDAAVRECLRALPDTARLLLAVSGGRDSMVLLDAATRAAGERVAAIATFDHGTGEAARRAVAHVEREGARLGVPVIVGRGTLPRASEAAWRDARWRFLRAAARERGALVATAHTRDDNVETILMRTMRGSGARGLAGLCAPGPVVRPLLELPRAAVARHAVEHSLRWIEDPSNESRAFFRNRVRHEILPALRAARPALEDELLDVARRAAELRRDVARVVDALPIRREDDALVVAATALSDYDPEELRVLWSELASRAGVVLDARGTAGLARFTKDASAGDRMQLSGGVEVLRRREAIVIGARVARGEPIAPRLLPAGGTIEWGPWRFRASPSTGATADARSPWWVALRRGE